MTKETETETKTVEQPAVTQAEEQTQTQTQGQEEEKEVQKEQPDTMSDSQDPKPTEPRNKISSKNRINQLTGKWREAEREKERLQAKLDEVQQARKIEKLPSEDDYDNYEAYLKDRNAYDQQKEEEIRHKIKLEIEEEKQAKELERERVKVATEWQNKKNKAVKKFDNFVESEQDVLGIIQNYNAVDMQECILESKVGPAMVDYLANNYEEAERIAQLPPRAQARKLLRLEQSLENKPAPKTKPAPEPIKPLSTGGAKIDKAVVDMSQAEYRKWCKERGMN